MSPLDDLVRRLRERRWTNLDGSVAGPDSDCHEAADIIEALALPLHGEGCRVPAGWQLVPKEPTEAMAKAGREAIPAGHGQAWLYAEEAYHAMLAAAPLGGESPK